MKTLTVPKGQVVSVNQVLQIAVGTSLLVLNDGLSNCWITTSETEPSADSVDKVKITPTTQNRNSFVVTAGDNEVWLYSESTSSKLSVGVV